MSISSIISLKGIFVSEFNLAKQPSNQPTQVESLSIATATATLPAILTEKY